VVEALPRMPPVTRSAQGLCQGERAAVRPARSHGLDDASEVVTADRRDRGGGIARCIHGMLPGSAVRSTSRRVLRDVEMEHASAIVNEDDDHEEDAEGDRGTVKKSTATICLTWLSRNVRK